MTFQYQARKALWALERIWNPHTEPNTCVVDEYFSFSALWYPKVELSIHRHLADEGVDVLACRYKGAKRTGVLTTQERPWRVVTLPRYPDERQKDFDEFTNAHLTEFRRCCWLSGCDIQTTGHEAMEWRLAFNESWPGNVPFFDARALLQSFSTGVLTQ